MNLKKNQNASVTQNDHNDRDPEHEEKVKDVVEL